MAATIRAWFVIPLDIKTDGKVWYGADTQQPQRFGAIAEEARPRRDARRNELEAQPVVDDGVGVGIASSEAKNILCFTTKGKAKEYAEHMASLNPLKLYGVYSCDSLYETTKPTVIEKAFNDAGELVLTQPVAGV